MRFDIDYSQAKTMATRLQTFLEGSPKKLSRSSAIEAVAQMLGFNNRNEMAARIDTSAPNLARESKKAPAHTPYPDPKNPREVALDALNDLRQSELQKTARTLVEHGRKIAPYQDFENAMHAENHDTGAHVLMDVEDQIVQNLLLDPQHRALLAGTFAEDPEMEGARAEGLEDLPSLLARTLVNTAMPLAETMWEDQEDSGPLPLEETRHDAATREFESYDFKGWLEDANGWEFTVGQDDWTRTVFFKDYKNLHGDTVRGHFTVIFEPGTANIAEAYASVQGNDVGQRHVPTWDIKITCMIPATLEVQLADEQTGKILAWLPHEATTKVLAFDESTALSRAREEFEASPVDPEWKPRQGMAPQDVQWASLAKEGDAADFVAYHATQEVLPWAIDYARADTVRFQINN